MTQIWTGQELEDAFRLQDAIYIDPMVGVMRGHERIRPQVTTKLGTFPGSVMRYPEAWHLVDVECGRIIRELRNVLRDPGDGSPFEENSITILDYAGDGRFRCERHVYDSLAMIGLIDSWGRRCFEFGTLEEDELAWFAAAYPHVLE